MAPPAVVALIGVGMLTSSGGDPTWGDALCIASAVLFGVHKWRSESVRASAPLQLFIRGGGAGLRHLGCGGLKA